MPDLFSQPQDKTAATSAPRAEVQEVVRGWDRALRAFLLYEGTGPTIERLMALLRRQTAALWDVLPELSLTVEENVLRWGEEGVYAAEAGTENLAFVFYRDGIRELTLLPGFEDETAGWVALLARVQRVRSDDEDLLTLLWDGEWRSLRYLYVDSSSDGAPLPGGSGRPATAVSAPVEEESAATSGVSPDNFQGALYFLDDAEIRRLGDDLRAEMGRDLLADVVAALMDRFEDGTPARQELVVGILADLLPVLLGAGQLARAVELLREMADLRSAAPTPSPPVLQAISTLFERLGDPEVLAGLVSVANDVPEVVASDALQRFLALLYPSALGALVRLVPDVESERIRAAVLAGAERLAAAHPEEVRPLLQSDDPATAAGAARLSGALGRPELVEPLVRLLGRSELAIRLAALEALRQLRSPTAAAAIERLLDDPERDVRIAAARALAELRYTPAGPTLERALDSRRLADADLTERIAFFEAYGSVVGAAGVARLERLLNGRGWLGRREAGELRACAALGLGRITLPAAKQALAAAAADPDPVVRNAVTRAIRGLSA